MGMVSEYLEWRGQQRKMGLVLGAFGLFFVSGVMSCQELRYMVSGKTVEVGVSAREETTVERDGYKDHHLVAGYSYDDNGTRREKFVKEPLDWPLARKGMVKIQYIPGRDASRFLGETNKGWVIVFFGSLAACAVGVFVLAREG